MKRIGVCILVLLATIVLNNSFSNAKPKSYVKGNFKFEYEFESDGVRIERITPLSKKGISKLVIPGILGGKKVVCVGAVETCDDGEKNVFGVWNNPEGTGLEPQGLVEKVEKIKTIVLPKSLEAISGSCFMHLPSGKSINIPEKFVENVMELAYNLNWKKVTISPKHPLYSITNDCLLSKNKKELYAILTDKSKVSIPNTVKKITGRTRLNYATKALYIPKSVTKIEQFALSSARPVRVSISKRNTHYGVKKGSIYSKKTGRLVLGYISKDGVLDVPDTVTKILEGSYVGQVVKKIIIPKSVKKIEEFTIDFRMKKLTVICKRKTPPILMKERLEVTFSYPDKLTILVPKGSKASYKKWKLDEVTTLKEVS